MKNKIFFIIGILYGVVGIAQQSASKYDLSMRVVAFYSPSDLTHYFKNVYDSYTATPIFLTESSIHNFTRSSLYYNHTMGSDRLGKTPDKEYHIGLSSHGIYRHKKALFFGKLQMERFYEKQKAWNISYMDLDENGTMPDPHYFGVSLPADWNNQKYHVKGGVILPVIEEKWDVLLSADYTLQERYRTETDPRAQLNYVQWIANAQTALTFNRHKVSIGGHIGYTNTQNNTSFTDLLNDSPDKYNRYLKWQLGYGTLQNRSFRNTKSRNLQYGANVGYHYNARFKRYWGSVAYERRNNDTYINNSRGGEDDDDRILANYQTDAFTLRANYLKNYFGDKHLHLSLTASNIQGKNYLNRLQGSNYVSQENHITLTASLLKQDERGTMYDLGLKTRFYQHWQKDGLAQTTTDVAFLEFKPYYSTEIKFYKSGSFIPTLSVGYRTSLYSRLTNENIDYHKPLLSNDYAAQTTHLFYDEVVYPAQAYFSKNRYILELSGDFKFYLPNKKTLLFTGVYSQYQSSLERNIKARYSFGAHFTVRY